MCSIFFSIHTYFSFRFEVVSTQQFPSNGVPFLRRLPPLEIQRNKKKKKELTYEEIQKKLSEAEERRKVKLCMHFSFKILNISYLTSALR